MSSRASRRTVDPKRAIEAASGACPRNPLGELEPLETAAEAGQGVLRRIGLDIELLDLVELTLQIGQLALVRAPFLLMPPRGTILSWLRRMSASSAFRSSSVRRQRSTCSERGTMASRSVRASPARLSMPFLIGR